MIKTANKGDELFQTLLWDAYMAGLYSHDESVFYELYTKEEDCVLSIALLYRDNEPYDPIGVCLTWLYPEYHNIHGEHMGAYILPNHRRMGYGSKLVKSLGGLGVRQWMPGETGSGDFWIRMEKSIEDLEFRLRERARIRRSIPHRKSVLEGKPDRISDLLEEAADEVAKQTGRPYNSDMAMAMAHELGLHDMCPINLRIILEAAFDNR